MKTTLLAALVLAATTLHAQSPPPNALTAAETKAGWKLLFDGKTPAGWREFHAQTFPAQEWVIEDGSLKHLAGRTNNTDIITLGEYANFELELDWKISPAGNSGLKYLISEDLIKTGNAGLGFEMQVLDDDKHPDAKLGKDGDRTAGSLYDLIPAAKNKVLRPVGEWNHARLVVKNGHIEHWLNGVKVVEFDMGSDDLKRHIAESKFKNDVGFGEVRKGHILLQGHTDDAWFRAIKIHEL